MKNSIATIKTLFWATVTTAIVTLVLSYLQTHHNNWLLLWCNAIMIGFFASSFVVLLCEIVRYRHLKSDAEAQMYGYSLLLFSQLSSIQVKIESVLKESQMSLHPTFIQPNIDNIVEYIDRISVIEYSTLCNNRIWKALELFRHDGLVQLNKFVSTAKSVEIAILEDTKDILMTNLANLKLHKEDATNQYEEHAVVVTPNSPKAKDALENTKKEAENALSYVESFINVISEDDNERFDWGKNKEEIMKMIKIHN
jgi:hypothetical protein